MIPEEIGHCSMSKKCSFNSWNRFIVVLPRNDRTKGKLVRFLLSHKCLLMELSPIALGLYMDRVVKKMLSNRSGMRFFENEKYINWSM